MKRILALLLLLPSLAIAQKETSPLLQEIVYRVRIQNTDAASAKKEWWHENIQPSAHYSFIAPLMEGVRLGKIPAYSPDYPYNFQLTIEEIDRMLTRVDSMQTDGYDGDIWIVTKEDITVEKIGAMEFHENWYYDSAQHILRKEIKGIVLMQSRFTEGGEFMGYSRLFYVQLNNLPQGTETGANAVVIPSITYDVTIKNPDEDTREMEWWHANLEPSKRAILRNSTYTPASKGETTAYSAKYPYNQLITPENLASYLTHLDTVFVENRSSGEMQKTVINSTADANNINTIRFSEEWVFDPDLNAMRKTVKGIVFMEDYFKGQDPAVRPLFYVPLNNYIPTLPKKPAEVKISRIELLAYTDTGTHTISGIDTARFSSLIWKLTSEARTGQRTVYKNHTLTDGRTLNLIPFTASEVDHYFAWTDTVMMEDLTTGELIPSANKNALLPKDVDGLFFDESWSFDPVKYRFTKDVKNLEVNIHRSFEHIEIVTRQSTFSLPMRLAGKETMKPEHLLGKDIWYDVMIDNTDNWLNEIPYNNWWVENLEIPQRAAMIQQILNDAAKGKIRVYDPTNIKKKLSKTELEKRMIRKTWAMGEVDKKLKEQHIDFTLIHSLRFHEEWYWDEGSDKFIKKVKGITIQTIDPITSKPAPVFYVRMK